MASNAPSASETEGDGGSPAPGRPAKSTAKAKQLLEAAGQGDLERVVGLLGESGEAINSLRVRGCTALHEAAKGGHLPVVTDLLHRSAEVNAVNRSGCTPLHFAVLCKDKPRALEVAEFLLDTSAVVNATAERMDTPLHFAAYCPASPGSDDLVRCLLGRRASVNSRNKKSESALMNACLHDNAGAARVLLESGADANLQNSLSKTARDLATEHACAEALQVLEQLADPISQLKDISQQMRSALSQMQSVETMRSELRSQAATAEAYESLAQVLVSGLDGDSRGLLADGALQALRGLERGRAGGGAAAAAAAPLAAAEQARLLQALATLLLVARGRGGPALLLSLGLVEALPFVEQQVARDPVGARELRELKMAAGGHHAELLAELDRSQSSTPSSCLEALALANAAPTPHSHLSQNRCQSSLSTASSVTAHTGASLCLGHKVLLPHCSSPPPGVPDRENESDSEGLASQSEPLALGAQGVAHRPQGLRLKSAGAHRARRRPAPTPGRGAVPLFADESQVVSEEAPEEDGWESCSAPSSRCKGAAAAQSSAAASVLPSVTSEPSDEGHSGGPGQKLGIERLASARSSKCCPRQGRSTCVLI